MGGGGQAAWLTAGRISIVIYFQLLVLNYSRTLTSTLGNYFRQEVYIELANFLELEKISPTYNAGSF